VGHVLVGVSLPRDAKPNDVFILDTSPAGDSVEIPLADFINGESLEAEILTTIFADRVISKLLSRIEESGRESLRKKGFGPS
jgi:hypothetical protein